MTIFNFMAAWAQNGGAGKQKPSNSYQDERAWLGHGSRGEGNVVQAQPTRAWIYEISGKLELHGLSIVGWRYAHAVQGVVGSGSKHNG